ncbi:MAG: hypothetical protein M1838_006110 [Thelocarpon superellum]|nr:MAG: hypothetical protein M1838_006110 [Thelocarpon superellum]
MIYGTLLGSTVYQSFFAGVIGYKTLPRPQFSALQQATFPVYFALQTALPAIIALTYPGDRNALGGRSASSLRGFFAEANRLSVLAPLLTAFGTGLANLLWLGPLTTKTMHERKHQETLDGKKCNDAPPHSKEMTRLNKAFGRWHGASAMSNLVGLFATMAYGLTLAGRID